MHPLNKVFIGVVSASMLSGAALWEGTRYYAYKDIVGVPTVCQGYTGSGIVFGRKYTEDECRVFLRKELIVHANGVLECVTQPMKPNEFDAFTLMAYNVGVNGFCGSRAVKLFNAGNTLAACRAMAYGPNNEPVWSFAGGKFVQGLFNRRKYEMAMCLGNPDAD